MSSQESATKKTIQWLCSKFNAKDVECNSSLKLEGEDTMGMLSLSITDENHFAEQYAELVHAARQNMSIATLELDLLDSMCRKNSTGAPIYDALCSLQGLSYLKLVLAPSVFPLVTRMLSRCSHKLRGLTLVFEEQYDINSYETLSLTQAAELARAVRLCLNLEAYSFSIDTNVNHSAAMTQLFTSTGDFPNLVQLAVCRKEQGGHHPLSIMDVSCMIIRHSSTLRVLRLESLFFEDCDETRILITALETVCSRLESFSLIGCQSSLWANSGVMENMARTIGLMPKLIVRLELIANDFPIEFYITLGRVLQDKVIDGINVHAIGTLEIGRLSKDQSYCQVLHHLTKTRHVVVDRLILSRPDQIHDETTFFAQVAEMLRSDCCGINDLSLDKFPSMAGMDATTRSLGCALQEHSCTRLRRFHFSCLSAKHFISNDTFAFIVSTVAHNPYCTLQELTLPVRPNNETLQSILTALKDNTTLKILTTDSTYMRLDKTTETTIVRTLEKNYCLQNLDRLIPPALQKDVDIILKLNEAGRCYLIDESLSAAMSIQRGVEVLTAVRDNLDCLFYHLRENPALCNCQASFRNDDRMDETNEMALPLSVSPAAWIETSKKRKQI